MKIQIEVPKADHDRLLNLYAEARQHVHEQSLTQYAADVLNLGIEMAEHMHKTEGGRAPEAEVCPFTPGVRHEVRRA